MSVLRIIFILSIPILFSVACNSAEKDALPLHTVEQRDFSNIVVLEGVVEAVQTVGVASPEEAEIAFLVEDGTRVQAGDTVCVLSAVMLEDEYDRMLVQFEQIGSQLETAVADFEIQMALMEVDAQTNDVNRQIARLDSASVTYLSPRMKELKELELRRSDIEREKQRKEQESRKTMGMMEIQKLQLQIQQAQGYMQRYKSRIEGLVLTAPVGGLVVVAESWNAYNTKLKVGDVIWDDQPVLQIPSTDILKVKLIASERDFKAVNVGDSIYYTFNAMQDNIAYGQIVAKVPVAVRTGDSDSKAKFFELQATLKFGENAPDIGFTTAAHIVLNEQKNVIAVPRIAVYRNDTIDVVYVDRPGGYEMRQVKTGLSSQNDVVITAGLEAGENIAMLQPKESQVRETVLLPDTAATVKNDIEITDAEE